MEITPIINEDFLIFNDEDTLSSMIGRLRQFEKSSGLVFRNNKYLGLVERKRLLRSRMNVDEAKVKNFVKKAPLISRHADIIETAYLMFQSDVHFLPVEADKNVLGVVSAVDVAKLASELPEAKGFKVSDVKFVKPKKISRNDPVSAAIEIMYQERIDQVPVFDQGKLFGIISYRDLLKRYLSWSPRRDISTKFNKSASTRSAEVDMPNLSTLPVSNFSTNDNLLIIKEAKSLKEAVKIMAGNGVSDLIVTKGGDVEGLLTVKNILRKIGSLKIPQNFNIQFIGLNEAKLKPHQKYNIKKIASNESFKLQRMLNCEFTLVLHVKEYSKGGSQHKFSVTMRIESPGQIITSTQHDWDIETALRKTFNNAKNKVKKKYRGDSSRRKEYE